VPPNPRHPAPPAAVAPVDVDGTKPRDLLSRIGAAPRAALAALGATAVALAAPAPAEAARSGGRMGGSAFRSSSFSSGGYGGRSSFSSSAFSPGSNYGSSLATRSRYGSAVATRAPGTSVHIHTGPRVGYFPFGFGYGYYGGGFGFGGLGTIITLAFMAYLASTVMGGGGLLGDGGFGDSGTVTVAKVQIGLLADNRRMQNDLQKIVGRADTSTPDGLHFVLTETVLALLRRPEVWAYATSTGKQVSGLDRGEELFNEFSLSERGKFQKETFVNYGGRARKNELAEGEGSSEVDELVVVTVLVAYEGSVKLTKCRDLAETRECLEKLGGLASDAVLAAEVLWTPSDPSDSYTRDDITVDYPELNNL